MSKLTGPEALSLLLYAEGDRESTIRKLTAVRGELAADEEWLKKVLDGLQEKIRQMPEAVFQDCILHAEEYQ